MDVAFTVEENECVKKKYKKKNHENVNHIPRRVPVNPPINEASMIVLVKIRYT